MNEFCLYYGKKIKLPIKNIETNIILNALIQFKNDKLKQGIYIKRIR